MDKNSIIGFILIGVILFGFTFYQSKEQKKQALIQAKQDSIAFVEAQKQAVRDSARQKQLEKTPVKEEVNTIYKNESLASYLTKQEEIIRLENNKFVVEFTTKGAQPYSVKLKNYRNYDSTDTYLFKPKKSDLSILLYANEYINTADFVFDIEKKTEKQLVMRLKFSETSYIEQSYTLKEDSYQLSNQLSFVGMESIIPKRVSSIDLDYRMTLPRMEKGYSNEVRYSKLDYYFPGDKKPEDIGSGKDKSETITSACSWIAFQQQFFSAILRAPNKFASGDVAVKFYKEDDPEKNLMTCSAKMRIEYKAGSDVKIPFEYYFGPNHYQTLKKYDQKYEKIIPLGGWLVGWFTKYVIIPMFNFLNKSITNYGLIILLMTLFIKLLVLPFAYKSYSSSAKMQVLKPEIAKLSEKYPKQEDAMKKQQATMNLYKRAGVSPAGGCLPMLLQFPILWAMFRFFPASIELRQQSFLWADDLSSFDTFFNFGAKIPLIGDHISLFALLMAASMFFYSRLNSGQMAGDDQNAKTMRFMSLWMMPIMMFFICNNLSAGLSYYYLLSNLITIAETYIIRKFFVHPEEVLERLKATEGKPIQKSKWQIRLEQAQKMQQEAKKNKK